MVESKKLTRGIMYECIKKKVPFVLAGSLRDDGPLPDVITDVALAQKKIQRNSKGCIIGNNDSYHVTFNCNWKHASC